MSTTNTTATAGALPRDPSAWRVALADLPSSTPNGIPAFYFAHGSPALAMPGDQSHPRFGNALTAMGPKGPHAQFLADFGPALIEKYQPKGIVVFSAHWDEHGPRQGVFDI
jgi:aromatic ring-opening dioxygenase catalytic subunit (LigB family)